MIKIITSCFLFCFVFLSTSVVAQNDGSKSNFNNSVSLIISADFLSQSARTSSNWGATGFLYSNPAFGVEMNYALTNHFIINAGLAYTGNHSENIGQLDYFVYPGENAIHSIKSEDTFRSLSFEPKAKLEFSLNRFGFFWSAGPIISLATLQIKNQTSTFENPKHFNNTAQNTSRAIGYGGQASTGFTYDLTKNLGLSFELGYKSFSHESLETMSTFDGQTESVNYTLNSVFQRVGIVLNL